MAQMDNIWIRQPIQEWLPVKWYAGFLPGLPDLCVGRMPAVLGLSGPQAWKVWYVETPEKNRALREALAKPIPLRDGGLDFERGPDATTSKVNRNKDYGEPVVALYAPNADDKGWPWFTVFRLSSVKAAGPHACELGRGVYSYEIDMSEQDAMQRIAQMGSLTAAAGVISEIVYPDHAGAM